MLMHIVLECLACDGFDDEAQPVDVDTVGVLRAGVGDEGSSETFHFAEGEIGRRCSLLLYHPVERGLVKEIVCEARRVRHAMQYRCLGFGRPELYFTIGVLAVHDLDVGYVGYVLLDVVRKGETALLDELEGGDAGDELGGRPHYDRRRCGVLGGGFGDVVEAEGRVVKLVAGGIEDAR